MPAAMHAATYAARVPSIYGAPRRATPLVTVVAARRRGPTGDDDDDIDPASIAPLPGYTMLDMSDEYSSDARLKFLDAIADPATANLAEAALQIAAEDDALVSNSSVAFPVDSFHRRLQRLADEISRSVLPPLVSSPPPARLDAIVSFLFEDQRFQAVARSSVPLGSRVDHPGVWENPKNAYLNELLCTKRALPAVLAILLADVLRRLLLAGAIDFVAKVEYTPDTPPAATVLLPGVAPSAALNENEHKVLAMCTVDALAESLGYLKRAFWPWPWAPRAGGGFRAAAQAFLDGAESAEAEAIARAAKNRLDRGIWTSPGAGDLRRAIAASERLTIIRGDAVPAERRDLAVLYCHAGRLAEARVELRAYSRLRALSEGQAAMVLGPAGLSFAPGGGGAGELADAVLADRLAAVLSTAAPHGTGVKALCVEEARRRARKGGSEPPRERPLPW